jgi:hypothetical protein
MDRIAALEQKIAEAQAELQALKAGRPSPPKGDHAENKQVAPLVAAYEDRRGVTISTPLTETNTGPTLTELRRLYEITNVYAPWPLAGKHDEDRPLRSFMAAFRWAQNVGRQDVPNSRVDLSYWLDAAKQWLRARNAIGEVDVNGLLMAVWACGDIAWQKQDLSQGRLWEIALVPHGGRPASADAWRQVLQTGVIRPAVHSPRQRVELPPVRAIGF